MYLDINSYSAIVSTTAMRSKGVTAEHLSKVWHIDKETADRTINCATQLKKQDMEGDVSRNFSTNDRMLRYKRIGTHFFTDTFQAKMKCMLMRGYQYCLVRYEQLAVLITTHRHAFHFRLKRISKEVSVNTFVT